MASRKRVGAAAAPENADEITEAPRSQQIRYILTRMVISAQPVRTYLELPSMQLSECSEGTIMRRLQICAYVYMLTVAGVGGTQAEIDVFMRAVGYALTGSDDAEPKAIGRSDRFE
jgi:hypothetical protein